VQEFAPDPAIEPDAAGDVMDVGPDLFAKIGHFVDEGDLHGQECVGGVLGQLGGLDPGEHDRRLDQVERAVEALQHLARAFTFGADHHTVGPHEVADRISFAQEFRV